MRNKFTKFWTVPAIFAAVLAVSACSSDPMMKHDDMGKGMGDKMMNDSGSMDKGMDNKMMDDSMDKGMDDSMDSGM
jgi:hypothetical protein